MKLKKRINLFEDFKNEVTNNATKPQTNTVSQVNVGSTKTETQTNTVKTDVLKDVDSILNNLEVLSSQIAEEIIREYELQLESMDFLYEASFMEEVMKQFKSMKSYAKLKGSYKGLRQKYLDIEVQKEEALGKFDSQKEEKVEAALAQVKKSFDAKKEGINQSDLPREKKTAARQKIDELWKTQQEKIKTKLNAQLDNKKAQITTQFDQQITATKKDLSDFEAENKIESEFIAKQWAASKVKVDNEQDLAHIQNKFEAKAQFDDSDDPEAAERQQKKMAEMIKKEKQEATEKATKAAENLRAAQEEADRRSQEGDEKTKAANAKLKDFYGSVSSLMDSLGSVDIKDYDDTAKLELKKKRKTYTEAKDKMSPAVFVDGGVAKDSDEGQEFLDTMTAEVSSALDDFKGVLDNIKDIKSDTEKAIDVAKEKEDDAKDALDLIDKAQDAEGYKKAQKTYFQAQIVTQQARKADAASNNKETEKFDTNIAQIQDKIQQLGGSSNEGDQTKSAEEVATEALGDAKSEYTKVTQDNLDNDKITVPAAEEGGEPTEKPKWTDVKRYKGKDAEGNDTDKEIIYAKEDSSESASTVFGTPITESFGFQTASIADRFRKLM